MGTSYHLRREQWLPLPLEKVFAFFSDAGNLEALTPPWLQFRIVTPRPIELRAGAELVYELSWRFIRLQWRTAIVEWNPPHSFVDEQASGPYRFWRHTHSFEAQRGGTMMRDSVDYELPLGAIGRIAHALRVRRDLERIFDYRAEKCADMCGGATL